MDFQPPPARAPLLPSPRRVQFGEDVGRITSAAAKELVIETELKKLGDLWKEQRFSLHKYTNVGAWFCLICRLGHAQPLCNPTPHGVVAMVAP